MPAAPLSTEAEIEAGLAALSGWERTGDSISKTFELSDFAAAVGFVSKLVPVADSLDHHPDVHVHWNRVELVLWTHASGGITARDFQLAEAIDAKVKE